MKKRRFESCGEHGPTVFSNRGGDLGNANHIYMEPPDAPPKQSRRSVAGNRAEDRPIGNAFRVIQALLSLCIVFSLLSCACTLSGCTASQRELFRDGLVSVSDCSLHSTIGCVATSMGACATPLNTFEQDDWKHYADCLAQQSAACSVKGIGLCAYRSIIESIDGDGFVAGGVGCAQMTEEFQACLTDSRIETEAEAVQVVAFCQRTICGGN